MKLGIHSHTSNRRFPKALRRIYAKVQLLEQRLTPVTLYGRFNSVMLTFVDEEVDVIRVTRRGRTDDIYEVDVGYDFTHAYPKEDDVLVVQLIEEKLKQIFSLDAGFAVQLNDLLRIVEEWTTESIMNS